MPSFQYRENVLINRIVELNLGRLYNVDSEYVEEELKKHIVAGVSILFQSKLYEDEDVQKIGKDFVRYCLDIADKHGGPRSSIVSSKINNPGVIFKVQKGMNEVDFFVGRQEKIDKQMVKAFRDEWTAFVDSSKKFVQENKIVYENRDRLIRSTMKELNSGQNSLTVLNKLIDEVLANQKKYRHLGKKDD